jgi:hypothetical protein
VNSGVLYQAGFEALDRFRSGDASAAATKGKHRVPPTLLARRRDRMNVTTSEFGTSRFLIAKLGRDRLISHMAEPALGSTRS